MNFRGGEFSTGTTGNFQPELTKHQFVRNVLRCVVIGKSAVWIEVDRSKLSESLLGRKPESGPAAWKHQSDIIKLTAEFQPERREGELYLVTPMRSRSEGTSVPTLVKAIARARNWYEQIAAGKVGTVGELAQKTGLTPTYVKRILQCAMLSPEMTETILSGKHRPNLTLRDLLTHLPIDWREQRDRILTLQ